MSMRKLLSKKGESIAETLVATLIISMAFIVLAGAIVTAAKINAKIDNTKNALDVAPDKRSVTSGDVVFSDEAGDETYSETGLSIYSTPNGYIYYE